MSSVGRIGNSEIADISLLCGEGVCFSLLWFKEKNILWLQANELVSVDPGLRFLFGEMLPLWLTLPGVDANQPKKKLSPKNKNELLTTAQSEVFFFS